MLHTFRIRRMPLESGEMPVLQVLLLTRSDVVAVRLAAIETTFNVVTALREEFLQLLPETLPFLAELLEDSERAVEARAQDVVKLLESLSEEDLAEYLQP